MKISGINGGNSILCSMAKSRFEQGWLEEAYITGRDNQFIICFSGEGVKWNGLPLVLSSTRNPYEPRVFKSIDGAMSELLRIGFKTVEIRITDENEELFTTHE